MNTLTIKTMAKQWAIELLWVVLTAIIISGVILVLGLKEYGFWYTVVIVVGCSLLALKLHKRRPIPMILRCPKCNEKHVDAPEPGTSWDNPPHKG